jgi:hypothetical protein
LRQPDERATAVVRIRVALDEPGSSEPVEPLRHPTRGQHGRLDQIGGVELERVASATQRGEHVEPTWPQAVTGDLLRKLRVGELRGAEHFRQDSS